MSIKRVYTKDELSMINELVNQNVNPNKISEELKYKSDKTFPCTTIENQIKYVCGKTWVPHRNKYFRIIDEDFNTFNSDDWIEEFIDWIDLESSLIQPNNFIGYYEDYFENLYFSQIQVL